MKFVLRSFLILLTLYGLVLAVGDAYLAHSGAPLWFGVLFAVGIVSLQFLVSPLLVEFFLDIVWDDDHTDLPAVNREFLQRLCAERGLKVPRLGIIYGGAPNAFSFGRLRSDARIVVTKGLLDILSPEEANAVLAHELGHIEHYDFVVITVAGLAPLLLYQVYAFTNRIHNMRALAWGAYLCYWVSQYIVLILNRTREYFADHYASEVTREPGLLASALVKIAYGLLRSDGEYRESLRGGEKQKKALRSKQHRLDNAVAVMGICNVRSGAALALGTASPEAAAAVMRWDLVNPWGRLYELSSTHPLTALRVRALNRDADAMEQTVQYALPRDQHIRWGRFPIELAVWAAPRLCAVLLLANELFYRSLHSRPSAFHRFEPAILIALGVSWMIRIAYRYWGEFQDAEIGSLLEDLDVSEMRPRAVKLRGEIIGRGVPGAFWSADLVIRDATGLLFVLYRQSFPFARLFFALGKADEYIGRHVELQGWFRRGLTPYIELDKLTDGEIVNRAYSRWIQGFLAATAIAAGFIWVRYI